mmetsp:Transcript_16418/g.23359  ORF Transcript_16418/g.23359 Transcript_16418/m.23359 type:complete len:257 (+) Transcript_16418:69-839(+)
MKITQYQKVYTVEKQIASILKRNMKEMHSKTSSHNYVHYGPLDLFSRDIPTQDFTDDESSLSDSKNSLEYEDETNISGLSRQQDSMVDILVFKKNLNAPALTFQRSQIFAKSATRRRSPKVSFGSVQLREYPIILGDNPSCSYGPPVTISWDYEEFDSIKIDDYEELRGERRTMSEMMMNYYHRKHLLTVYCGYKKEDLKKAASVANRIKRQRAITEIFMPFRKVEEVASVVRGKLKRSSPEARRILQSAQTKTIL